MIKWGAPLLMLAALSAPVHADDDGPASYRPTPVRTVTITAASATLDMGNYATAQMPEEECSDFVMTTQKVKEFFRHARKVSQRVYTHDLEWSRCYAEGSVTFANMDMGRWTISRFGKGSLLVVGGKNGAQQEQPVLLHCRQCEQRW